MRVVRWLIASGLTLLWAVGFLSGCEELPVGSISGNSGTGSGGFTVDLGGSPPAPRVSQVVSGNHHACARYTNGQVKCWGRNHLMQLGLGDAVDRDTPVSLTAIGAIVELFAGGDRTCGRKNNGELVCWGDGLAPATVTFAGGASASYASLGSSHLCAVLSGGGVQCFGANTSGQLGDGTTAAAASPVSVTGYPSLYSALVVASGADHSCAIHAGTGTGGDVYCWGDDSFAQLGNSLAANPQLTPIFTDLGGTSTLQALSIAAGNRFTCAVETSSGNLRCWGDNSLQQLGTAAAVSVNTLSAFTASTVFVGAGSRHACALTTDVVLDEYGIPSIKSDGKVKCWGSNASGQLGSGSVAAVDLPADVTGIPETLAPVPPSTATRQDPAVDLGLGDSHSCALLQSGAVKCWGDNSYGQLGTGGAPASSSTPVDVTGL